MYLGKHGYGTAKIDLLEGGGLQLTPTDLPYNYNGLFFKNGGQVFEGKGLLLGKDSPFRGIPILGLIL